MDKIIEQRRHPRRDVVNAIMIRPNGEQHKALVLDVSLGGARLRLPEDWAPRDGANVRMYFLPDSDDAVTLEARVTRVGCIEVREVRDIDAERRRVAGASPMPRVQGAR